MSSIEREFIDSRFPNREFIHEGIMPNDPDFSCSRTDNTINFEIHNKEFDGFPKLRPQFLNQTTEDIAKLDTMTSEEINDMAGIYKTKAMNQATNFSLYQFGGETIVWMRISDWSEDDSDYDIHYYEYKLER